MLLDSTLTIGQRFKHIRTEKGFSQAELAEGVCSKSVVSHLENDRDYPSANMLGKLADKLGVPLREIMGMQEKQMEAGFQIEIVRIYIEKADYNHALELINELDQRKDLLEHQRIELVSCRANCLLFLRKYEQVVDLLRPFLEQQQKQQTVSDEVLCDTYNKLGNAHYRLNDFEKAFSTFELGYSISLKLTDFGIISARISKNFGLTCNQLGFKEDAVLYLKKAYAFFEKMADMREVANTLFTMSLATGSVEYLTKARSLYEGLSMVREANIAKQHYAYHVASRVDYLKSLEEFDSSREGFEKLGDLGMCIYTLSRSAIVSINHGDTVEAEKRIKQADYYRSKTEKEDEYLLIDLYRAKAMYHLEQKNYDQCILNSLKSSEICAKIGLNVEGAISLELAADAYHQKGENELAFKASKQVIELLRMRRDSI